MSAPPKTIHSYVSFAVDIRNFYTYQDFLRKRPKKTQQFKFSIVPSHQLRFNATDQKQIQLNLLKILKITKPLIEVDLKEFITTGSDFWKVGLLSIWKKISHVKTLFVTMMKPEAKSMRRYFKYFPKLELLNYQLNDPSPMSGFPYQRKDRKAPNNYLKSLKYCPRIHSLIIQDFSTNKKPLKTGFESRRYLKSLDSLTLRNECMSLMEPSFPIEFCENLKSTSIRLSDFFCCQGLPQILSAIPTLSHLIEISLRVGFIQKFNFVDLLQKIAKRGILEKILLDLVDGVQNFQQIFEALKFCKLTCFSLRTKTQEDLFKSLSDFIQNMSSLESFNLDISNSHSYSNDSLEICKQINKLQALRNLKLNFDNDAETSISPKINCFIPYLSDVFKKSIKLESFHVVCNKLPASESLQSLIIALETATPFLTHLTIDFGTLPYTEKTYRTLLPFLKNLSKIQMFSIPCLAVNHSTTQYFIEMAKAISGCRDLREFTIGEIKERAKVSDVLNALQIILSKRGLRKFDCLISEGFPRNLHKEANIQFPNLKRIIESNPHLDTLSLRKNFHWLILSNQQWMLSL